MRPKQQLKMVKGKYIVWKIQNIKREQFKEKEKNAKSKVAECEAKLQVCENNELKSEMKQKI